MSNLHDLLKIPQKKLGLKWEVIGDKRSDNECTLVKANYCHLFRKKEEKKKKKKKEEGSFNKLPKDQAGVKLVFH